jgi:hypothetical protein
MQGVSAGFTDRPDFFRSSKTNHFLKNLISTEEARRFHPQSAGRKHTKSTITNGSTERENKEAYGASTFDWSHEAFHKETSRG